MDCLSNDSYYPFEVDGEIYPTVTHFIKIQSRDQKNIPISLFQLRIESKKNKKTRQDKTHLLEKAITEKFKQNPELMEILDSTGNSIIKSEDYITGEILVRIRETHRKSTKYNDVSTSQPTFEEYTIIKEILKLAEKIRLEERQTKLFDGMIEDAIYNILDEYNQDSFLDQIKKANTFWTTLPKFRQLVQNIERHTTQKGRIPMIIGVFIKFYREHSPILKTEIDTIIFPGKKRSYRKSFKV